MLQEYNSYQERVHIECFWEHNQSSTVATIYTRMHERSHGNLKNNYLYLILWLISLSSYPFICLFTNSLFFLDKVSCIFLFTHLDIYLQTWLPLYSDDVFANLTDLHWLWVTLDLPDFYWMQWGYHCKHFAWKGDWMLSREQESIFSECCPYW